MKNISKQYHFRTIQIISVLLLLLVQAFHLISPGIMEMIVDQYIPAKNYTGIRNGILLFIFLPFMNMLLRSVYNYFSIRYIRKIGNEISIRALRNLVYQKLSYFDSHNSLEILSHVSKEAVGFVNFYLSEMSQYYANIVLSFIVFLTIWRIHPLLACIQIIYYPCAVLPVKKMTESMEKEIHEVVSWNAKMNQVKGDIFQKIEFIKGSRLEDQKVSEAEGMNHRINGFWGKIAALDVTSGMWMSGFTSVLFTGLTFGAASFLVLENQLPLGKLISCIMYAGMFYAYMNSVLETKMNQAKQEAEYEQLFSYLTLTGEKEQEEHKSAFRFENRIELNNLSFSYDAGKTILDHVNMTFEKGKWTGIVGASGAGKSTILDLLLKMYDVSHNMILIDNTDINDISAFSLREHVTKITQNIYLFPGTIKDNMRLMNEKASDQEIMDALSFACLDEYISTLPKGILTDIGEAGDLMSGGEKQRLAIAMGILRNNQILLLDEVTSSIDEKTEAKLCEHFKALIDRGYTIVSISHKEGFLKYADRIYRL